MYFSIVSPIFHVNYFPRSTQENMILNFPTVLFPTRMEKDKIPTHLIVNTILTKVLRD